MCFAQTCLRLNWEKWDLIVTFDWGVLLTQGQCVWTAFCKIFSGTPHLNIFCTPKYAPQISYLAYLGADFFVDFSSISSRIIKKKKGKKQIRPTYLLLPFCDYSWWMIQGLCSPLETRTGGFLYDSDGCCKNGSPYKRSAACPPVKKALIKRGQSDRMLLKARQRTKSL